MCIDHSFSSLAQSPIKYDNSFIAVHKRLHRTLTSKGHPKLSSSSQWPLCTGSTVKAAFNSRGVRVRFLSSKISFPIPLTRDPRQLRFRENKIEGVIIKSEETSLRKQPTFSVATAEFPSKCPVRNNRRNSILTTCHYADLGIVFLIGRAAGEICFIQSEALPSSG